MLKKITLGSIMVLSLGMILLGSSLPVASFFEKNDDAKDQSQPAEQPPDSSGDQYDQPFTFGTFREVAKRESSAVVNISTSKIMKNEFRRTPRNQRTPFDDLFGDDFFHYFFGPQVPNQKVQSLGSGVIIDADGYILTNNHVIDGVDEIKVRTLGGKTYDAKVIGDDPQTDIALIKIDPDEELTVVEMGDSDLLEVGDWVMAIGNPFGFEHTVTVGVVSAKGRSLVMPTDELPYQDFIQTDASINPGNSGGPLLDIHGRLVGINSVIASRTGQSAGIGFAIAVNLVKTIIPELKDKGSVTRAWLGVSIQTMDADLARSMNLDTPEGALVAEVVSGSPAESAGIKVGDVILEFNGIKIKDSSHLSRQVASTPVGTKVKIKVLRGDDTEVLTTTLTKRESDSGQPSSSHDSTDLLGLTVQTITPELARQMNLGTTQGVLISDTEPNGPADNAGLRRGDVIIDINRKKITSVEEFQESLKNLKPGDVAVMYIQREDSRIFVAVKTTKPK